MAGSALQIGKTIQYDVTVWLDAVFVAKVVQQDIAVPPNAAVNICKVVQQDIAVPPNAAVNICKVVQQDIAVPSNAAVNICKVVQYLVVTDQLVSPPQIIHMA